MAASPTDDKEVQSAQTEEQTLDTAQVETESQDVNSADTSTAEDAEKPSMFDAVKSALEDKGEQSSSSGDEKGSEKGTEATEEASASEEAEGTGSEDVTDEELDGYRPRTRRRIKELFTRAKTAETERDALKSVAERMSKIDQFVEAHNLSREDMNLMFDGVATLKSTGLGQEDIKVGFNIMHLMATAPEKAYEEILPIMHDLALRIGEILPQDLEDATLTGKITEEHARELARSRASQASLRAQAVQSEERVRQEAHQNQVRLLAERGSAVQSAIDSWEENWKARDPDYSVKYAMWRDKMDVYVARIKSREEALPDAKTALAKAEQYRNEVDALLKKIRPQKTQINTTPASVGSSIGSKPAPATLQEAIAGALSRK